MTAWAHHHFRRYPWQDRHRCTTCGQIATTARDNAAAALRQQLTLRLEHESQASDWLADTDSRG